MKPFVIITKFTVICVFLIHSSLAFSADISLSKTLTIHKKYTIQFNGTIASGDANKLKGFLAKGNIYGIYLNSPGGDVQEAIKLAKLVEQYRQPVNVAGGGVCVSACFFIYIAANGRAATGIDVSPKEYSLVYGNVGIHRPYLIIPDGKTSSQSNQTGIMRKVTSYLEYHIVPRRIIDLMMSRPSNDIYWLTVDDIDELGKYPPALEELYISKCGYYRAIESSIPNNFLKETPNADGSYSATTEGEAAMARVDSVYDCIRKISLSR